MEHHSLFNSLPRRTKLPLPQSPTSFLGLPLGFLPGVVVVFRVLVAPLFLLPFGRPRGLLGVGTSLGSFGGCLRGRPRPRFSAPSFSCLEARGWLDFELDSLIFPRQQSRRGATAGLLGGRESVSDETSCVSHLQTLITPAQQETACSQGPPGLPPWPRVVCLARRAGCRVGLGRWP